jgi:hypothetical protein
MLGNGSPNIPSQQESSTENAIDVR